MNDAKLWARRLGEVGFGRSCCWTGRPRRRDGLRASGPGAHRPPRWRLVFQFAGHGTHFPEPSGTDDGRTRPWCPSISRPGTGTSCWTTSSSRSTSRCRKAWRSPASTTAATRGAWPRLHRRHLRGRADADLRPRFIDRHARVVAEYHRAERTAAGRGFRALQDPGPLTRPSFPPAATTSWPWSRTDRACSPATPRVCCARTFTRRMTNRRSTGRSTPRSRRGHAAPQLDGSGGRAGLRAAAAAGTAVAAGAHAVRGRPGPGQGDHRPAGGPHQPHARAIRRVLRDMLSACTRKTEPWPRPPNAALPSTPAAAAASAQTRVGTGMPPGRWARRAPGRSARRRRGESRGAHAGCAAVRARGGRSALPPPPRMYALDPAASATEGAVAMVNVPYERLRPGPMAPSLSRGSRGRGERRGMARGGPGRSRRDDHERRAPLPRTPFHQQMVYAVASLARAPAFRTALGRRVGWGFSRGDEGAVEAEGGQGGAGGCGGRRRTLPSAKWRRATRGRCCGHTAASCATRRTTRARGDPLRYRAEQEVTGRNVPGGFVFTCLSHVPRGHARPAGRPAGALPGAHRGRRGGVPRGVRRGTRGRISALQLPGAGAARPCANFARRALAVAADHRAGAPSLRAAQRAPRPLRTAIDVTPEGMLAPRRYRPDAEEHEMGSVLVSAVFNAYLAVYRRKTGRRCGWPRRRGRAAGGGAAGGAAVRAGRGQPAGEPVPGRVHPRHRLLSRPWTSRSASSCVLTAPTRARTDDPWGYREAWGRYVGPARVSPPRRAQPGRGRACARDPAGRAGRGAAHFARSCASRRSAPRPSGPGELRQARELRVPGDGQPAAVWLRGARRPRAGGRRGGPAVRAVHPAAPAAPGGAGRAGGVRPGGGGDAAARGAGTADGGGFVTYGGSTALL